VNISRENLYALELCLNTRCNFCRENCSIYRLSHLEFDSPRAKLEVIDEILNGRINPLDVIKFLNRCTGCKKCVETCPYDIPIPEIINEVRSEVKKKWFFKDKRRFSIKTGYPLHSIEKFVESGNPYGKIWPPMEKKENVDFTLFPGCVATFETPELLKITKKILDRLGINYDVAPLCCFAGLESFGFSKNEIISLFQKRDYTGNKTLIVICATCYNALKNIHGKKVTYIADFLLTHLRDKQLVLPRKAAISYHDPCHLGRYNNLYESPRELLQKVKNLELFEFKENRAQSLCCGGGGSLKNNYPLAAKNMAKSVMNSKPSGTILVTGCTYCKKNIEESTGEKVKHLVEVIWEAMRG